LTSVRRYACSVEKTPSAVATPNTHRQGGVHTFRIRAVSRRAEKRVKAEFSHPSRLSFITIPR
jgi:hypothetical protein